MTSAAPKPAAGELRFAKLVGAGNDFLFIDARSGGYPLERRAQLVRRLCDRHYGVGADGAAFVEGELGADLRWDFYNDDGSSAEMCGNAARCMVRWAQRALGADHVSFRAAAGRVSGWAAGNDVEADLPFVSRQARALEADLGGTLGRTRFWALNTGVPHAVVEVEDLESARRETDAIRKLRWAAEFGERGANVTFFAREAEAGRIASATFERGVEGFTLACGTGVIAAALASVDGVSPARAAFEMTVAAPGGALRVSVDESRPGVRLKGPADFVCEGVFAEEFMR